MILLRAGVLLTLTSLLTFGSEEPFWKSEKIYKKIKEDRYIAVSAKSSDVDQEKRLNIVSAGFIHAPADFTHDVILKFEDYPKFLSYIVEASYDKSTHDAFIHGAILGYHAQMTLHIDVEKKDDNFKIKWKSISGSFQGMTGVISENHVDFDHTEISMDSTYQGKKLGIPDFIMNAALEYAAQKTAGGMRSHIEEEWESDIKKH